MPRKNFTVSGIYLIRNTITGMVYIGSSAGKFGVQGRWDMHRIELRNNTHANPRLQASWNKHNEDDFVFEILEECSKDILLEREQHWIDFYRNQNNGLYNHLPVAGSRLGVPTSEETKRKLSERLKGRAVSEETIAKRCISRNALYSFVSPDGVEYKDIVNLKSFADDHGLNSNTLRLVWYGTYKHTKGWTRIDARITWYIVSHRSSGEVVRLHKGQLRSFCIERRIDISNLLKILKGKLKHANEWTIVIE